MRPAYCRIAAYQLFSQEISQVDTAAGLFRAACAIAKHERPEINLAEVEFQVDQISQTVRQRVHSNSSAALLAHLHDVLFDVLKLRGNVSDYYNPANSYMPDVLFSGKGIPISLVLVYKRVAEPLGLEVHGVNSPGHFLAEVESEEGPSRQRMYIDPFFGGGVLTREEACGRIAQATGNTVPVSPQLLTRATHEQWLYRMLMNLQVAFSAKGQERDVCAMQELQGLL